MSKLDQIQNALMGIDQANFQKLCDAYLHRTLDLKEISSVGSVAGESKTTVGQPDTLLTLKNGKYVLVEATTQKTSLCKKLSQDLTQCFKKSKTGVDLAEVEKIILACNRKLPQKDKLALAKKGQRKGCIVEFLDLDTLSFDLYQKFQPLAKEFLNVELDTGQILPITDFIKEYQRSKFATRLDNKFVLREKEKKEVLERLKTNDLLVLSGKAGVGKSKLAVESAKQFVKKHPSFQLFFIANKNLDIYENLKAYFGVDRNYLIVVDDANRLFSPLSFILQLLNQQTSKRKIKILLTVRDYALEQIKEQTKSYIAASIQLQKFTEDEISTLLDSYGIKNHAYVSRIQRICRGNPRLAIMAAEVAIKENTLKSINDVSELYDRFFSSISDDLNELEDKGLIQAAGILSFFRALDRTNVKFFESVALAFGRTTNELWTELTSLHELEIVDISYEVAKVSDQILATYLFYRAFFKDEVLDFGVLMNDSFSHFAYRLRDAVYPVLDTFDSQFVLEKLKPHVFRRWSEINTEEDKALQLIGNFYFTHEIEFLVYLKNRIQLVEQIFVDDHSLRLDPENYEPVKNRYLKVLRLFQSDNISIALDLIFTLLEKDLSLLPEVVHLILEDFCFNNQSYLRNYYIQENLLSKLIKKSIEEKGSLYKRILLKISLKYTQLVFRSNSSWGLSVTIHTTPLKPVEAMIKLRKDLWGRLIDIYRGNQFHADILEVIHRYSEDWLRAPADKKIVKNDAEILLPFMTKLDSESYYVCKLVQGFLDFLDRADVKFKKSIRSRFTNDTYRMSKILLTDDRKELSMGYEEYQKTKDKVRESEFVDYSLKDYQAFFAHCEEITKFTTDHERERFAWAISKVLVNLSEKDPTLFFEVLNSLFSSGNPMGLPSLVIIFKVVEKSPNLRITYQDIKKHFFARQNLWLFDFLQHLPKGDIDTYFLQELLQLYRHVDLNEIPQTFEFLENYEALDPNVIHKVVETLFNRAEVGKGSFSFRYLLSHSKVSEQLGRIFATDLPLLKSIYLFQSRAERYSDFENKALRKIYQLDKAFLYEYLDFLISEKNSYDLLHDGNHDFTFIWKEPGYDQIFRDVFCFIYKKETADKTFWRPSFMELFLRDLDDDVLRERALKSLENLFSDFAANDEKARYLFQLISNCFYGKRMEFLEIFLKRNTNFTTFQSLAFETNHIIAVTGSRIPALESKISFYEAMLPLFSTVDLLEHKLEISERIQRLRDAIEDAKKSDFIGHF
jgi:hypothetical protein